MAANNYLKKKNASFKKNKHNIIVYNYKVRFHIYINEVPGII